MNIPKKLNDLSYKVTGICMKVHKGLGPGFPEEYYQKALEYEFQKNSLSFEPQKAIEVFYEEVSVGLNYLDFVLDDILILEIKSVNRLSDTHRFQVIKYFACSNYPVALLVNFGEAKFEFESMIPPKKIQDVKAYDFSRFE